MILRKITRLFGNVLYYPGCMMKYITIKENERYKKILQKLGVDFIVLEEKEVCCGSPVAKAGYKDDYEKLVRKNFEEFKKHNITKIITPCPACASAFLNHKNIVKDWDIDVENALTIIAKKIKQKNIGNGKKITFHDPCHLGRYQGIYEEPRALLKKLGYDIVEMQHNKKFSLCCGAGGGFRANFPDIAKEAGKKREREAKDCGAKEIITSCPLCYVHLKENSKIPVLEISEILEKVFE